MLTERQALAESAEKQRRKNLLLKAAALGSATLLGMGLVGSKTTEAGAKSTAEQQMIIAGIEDEVLNEEFSESLKIAEKLKSAGFNTVKVTMPWTFPGQGAEIDNDLKRYQNAVQAAYELDMGFAVTMVPYSPKTGVGQAPDTISQMRRFADTAVSYLHAFAEKYPDGELIIGIGNEVNSETFWRPQDDEAAQKVVRLLSIAYPKLKRNAVELKVEVTVLGGELASNKKPFEFIDAMGKAKKSLGIKEPIMDVFALHPYGKTNDEAPNTPHSDKSSAGFGDFNDVTEAVERNFGANIPVWYTEYGTKTRIPADKTPHYALPPQKMSTLITEFEQAMYYSNAIKMAFCQKAGAVMLFNVVDDIDGHWTSGVYYPQPLYELKSSFDPIRASIENAKSGNIDC